MASVFTLGLSSCFGVNSKLKPHFRVRAERFAGDDLSVFSSNGVSVNGGAGSAMGEEEKKGSFLDGGNGSLTLKPRTEKELVKQRVVSEELEVLWDDGYGTKTVKDYLIAAEDMIKPDGGPPWWFCPLDCGQPIKDSPVLLFLPGLEGVGMGLILHHKALGKVFEVQCLHIPVLDRTPFEGLVELAEETIRQEHASRPGSPIYLVGDSFGGCLALAVAARNPTIDLVVILVNPATSFGRSPLQPLFPISEAVPSELHVTIPYLLSFVMGDPVKMATVGIERRLSPMQKMEQLSGNLAAVLPLLHIMANILPKETLAWKLKLLKSASAYANSGLRAVKAEVLVLASGKDNMLPSEDEAQRLKNSLSNCIIRRFNDNGHTLLLGEAYKLFWPDQPEFVRMAARFGATIIPFGTVGEDDVVELVIDYNDRMKIPVINERIKESIRDGIRIRDETKGEVANQNLFMPGMLPKIPGRFYYLFGKPKELKGREDLLKNREEAKELYL